MPGCITLDAAWEALVNGCGASVYVVSKEFTHVYVNEQGAAAMGLRASEVVGTPMGSHISEGLTEIVRSIIVKTLQSGEPMVQGFLYQGQLRQTNFVPIRSASGEFEHVLIMSHLVVEAPPQAEVMELLLNSEDTRREALGPLAKLTARELEILTFIGNGTRTADIADQLGLSQRTVHNHCASISKKLGRTTRSEMAQLAIRAGLSPRAATSMDPKQTSVKPQRSTPEPIDDG